MQSGKVFQENTPVALKFYAAAYFNGNQNKG